MLWYSHLSQNFPQFIVIHTVKGFGIVNKAENFLMFKLVLEKAEETEIKLPTSAGSQKKQENFRKTYTSASLSMLYKAFDCVEHNKL